MPSVDLIMEHLAQTQCQACGYHGCAPYAQALAQGLDRDITKCRPGGQKVADALAHLFDYPTAPIVQSPTFLEAVVSVDQCIGCHLCVRACPVDAIVGVLNYEHQVIAQDCTGCELCLPVCPTQCIEVKPRTKVLPSRDQTLKNIENKSQRISRQRAKQIESHQQTIQAMKDYGRSKE